jgi:hypothetical protein
MSLHENGCADVDLGWELPHPLPDDFLGIEVRAIQFVSTPYNPGARWPYPFPLEVGDLERYDGELDEAVAPSCSAAISHYGNQYEVLLYEGSGLTDQQRRELQRFIESIEPTDLPPTEPIRFGWLPDGAEVTTGFEDQYSPSQTAFVHFPDESGASDATRSVRVSLETMQAPLAFQRSDLRADDPQGSPSVPDEVPVERSRIEVRGVPAVLDRWSWGEQHVTRIAFLEHDNLAVDVTSHGVPEEELLDLVEGLQLVAVGGP